MIGRIVVVVGVDFQCGHRVLLNRLQAAFAPVGEKWVHGLDRSKAREVPQFPEQCEIINIRVGKQDRLGGGEPGLADLVGFQGFIQLMQVLVDELLKRPVAKRAVGIDDFHGK